FEQFLGFGSQAPRAHAVPNHDKNDRSKKDQRGDGVDLGCYAAPEAAPDFKRQSIVAANQEKGHGNFVHREREDEEAGSNQGEFETGERDAPEGLPGSGAEIKRRFFLSAIHLLKAGKEFGGGDGNKSRSVAKKDGKEAEVNARQNRKHQQGEASDDAGE